MPLSFLPSGTGTAATGAATIPGGTTDNFVSIASDDTLKDSGKSSGSFLTANTTITTGTYTKISYDAKGLVTGGTSLAVDDIPDLPFSKLTGTPTTLAGYGITDGQNHKY